MSVKRFSWILANLRVSDNTLMPKKGEPRYDKLYKIRTLLNSVGKHFETTRVVSNDESMIKFKGTLKQYMPQKTIKRCYKVCLFNNKNRYYQKFDIYTGKGLLNKVKRIRK